MTFPINYLLKKICNTLMLNFTPLAKKSIEGDPYTLLVLKRTALLRMQNDFRRIFYGLSL